VFLPGGWQTAKAPRLPLETWKQRLYLDVEKALIVPYTLPVLFAMAWERFTTGDVPRYHDLKEKP
jgi:hypothetical protein